MLRSIGRAKMNGCASEPTVLHVTPRRVSTKLYYAQEGKLYGRSKEKEKLDKIYHQVKRDNEKHHLILISGESGIGKTALAHSLRPIVEQDGGFLMEAKFEAGNDESIMAAFVMALSDFATQLLQSNKDTIDRYRKSIHKAVDEEARILVNLVPKLETILGKQTAEGGKGSQATKRIKYVFELFLQAISSTEYPLVFLLKNLHWANDASWEVLTTLISNVDGVLFVGTYREDETTTMKGASRMIDKLDSNAIEIHRMQLTNLKEDAVFLMLADALLLESEQLKSVGELVYSVTQGNVFFIMELLRLFQEEELLQFDQETQQWTCDSDIVGVALDVRTVHDLIQSKIADLPFEVQETLKVASCLGSRIDAYLLHCIIGTNAATHLNMAAAKGLLASDDNMQTFTFPRDDIRQVAYSLIDDKDRALFHIKIGRKLLRKLNQDELNKYIFVIARQLMNGDQLVTNHEEQAVLSSLYLRAGEKAVELSNFETAALYLKHGIALLGDSHWKDNYALSLRLYNAAAEVFYCTAHFDEVEDSVNAILMNARSFEDTLHARETQIYALGSRNRQPEAIEIGLATLKSLGEDLPSYPTGTQLMLSMWRVKRLLRGSTNESLMRLPVMKISRKVAAMQVLNLIYLSALYSRPLLAAAVAVRMVKLTVTYGKCAASCVAFGFYSMLLCSGGSSIDEGHRYSMLALQMYDEFQNESWLCRVTAAVYGCVHTWKEPVSQTTKPLDRAYRIGLATGDVEYAVLCASMKFWNNSSGFSLPYLDKEIRLLTERVEFLGQETALIFLKPIWQTVQNFMGLAYGDVTVLTGDIMNQKALTVEATESCPGLVIWIRLYCMILAFSFGDYDRAEKYSTIAHEIYDHSYGAMDAAFVLFYESMTLIAQAQRGKRGRISAVRRRLKRLRYWAKHAPLNFLGKQYLLEAEVAVATNDHLSVLSKYTSSIVLSREQGFIMEEALANERAGKYFLEQDNEKMALPFLREACRLYKNWGGLAKLHHLKQELKPLQLVSEET